MAVALAIDAVVFAVTTAIEEFIGAGIATIVESTTGATIVGTITAGLVVIGVEGTTAAAMAASFAGIGLDLLVPQISEFLMRALAVMPEGPMLLFSVPTSGIALVGNGDKSVLHPVQGFAQSIGEKLSPELTAELQKQVKDALNSAENDAKKYLSDQKSSILKTSLIPFYGWVEGTCHLYTYQTSMAMLLPFVVLPFHLLFL